MGRVIDRLSGEFQCIAVDLPGLGRTEPAPQGLSSLATLAVRLEEIRIRHGIEKWHIAGHDGGCAIAVEYAHRFPNRVERLALLTPSMFPDLRPFWIFRVLRKRILGELFAPIVNLAFWHIAMRLSLAGHPEMPAIVRDFRTPFRGPAGAWRFMALMRWGDPADVLASVPLQLTQISAPRLILHGSKDPAVPPTFAHRAAELAPWSQLILLDCGHFLPLSKPEAVAENLLRFFQSGQSTEVQETVCAVTAAGISS